MAKIVRYNGNLVPFASASLGTERTIFGDVTQADDITSQYTADFLRGWGIVGPSDQPTLQDFNAVSYTHGQILSYLHQMGIAEYNATQEYHIGSLCNVAGAVYSSLINTNVGNTPASSPAQWRELYSQASETVRGTVELATSAETIAGLLSTLAVHPAGLLAALVNFLPKRVFAANDFIRIPDVPGGLIIQFGTANSSAVSDTPVLFPTPFPNALRGVFGQPSNNINNTAAMTTTESETQTGFSFNIVRESVGRVASSTWWVAIGN